MRFYTYFGVVSDCDNVYYSSDFFFVGVHDDRTQ